MDAGGRGRFHAECKLEAASGCKRRVKWHVLHFYSGMDV